VARRGRDARVVQAMSKLKANFAFNVGGAALATAVALITVPIYVAYIGAARVGVISIVWILLGYFGFMDFGLSRASANALARLTSDEEESRKRVILTSIYLNILFGIAGAVVLYFAGGALMHRLVKMPDSLSLEVQGAFPWIACMLPLALVGGVAGGVLESRERFLSTNILNLINVLLGQIVPLVCAVLIEPTLTVVIPASFAARAISVGLSLGFVFWTERIRSIFVFDLERTKKLLEFGAWVSVTNVVGPLLTSVDQLLVGSTLGAVAIAYYSIPMNLVTRTQIIATALARTLFPRFSRLKGEEATELAERAFIALGYVFGSICGPAIILAPTFMSFWMGLDFASHATPIVELLLIGAWINGIAFIPFAFLQGQGRPDLTAKLHLIEFAPFVIVLWVLLQQFGLQGAALAWVGRVSADAILLVKVSRFKGNHLLRLAPALGLILASFAVARMANVTAVSSVFLAGFCAIVFVVSAAVFDVFSRKILLALFARLVRAFDHYLGRPAV
jgi:O-antigen/teichoic acid export membrane protein